jgi:hypothetical protein
MPKFTSSQAIQSASDYLRNIPKDLLGEDISELRLETIQLFGNEWVIVFSYLVEPKDAENPLLRTLRTFRRYREITMNADTGEILGLRSPKAEDTTPRPRPFP